jgi:hypothetical protein
MQFYLRKRDAVNPLCGTHARPLKSLTKPMQHIGPAGAPGTQAAACLAASDHDHPEQERRERWT